MATNDDDHDDDGFSRLFFRASSGLWVRLASSLGAMAYLPHVHIYDKMEILCISRPQKRSGKHAETENSNKRDQYRRRKPRAIARVTFDPAYRPGCQADPIALKRDSHLAANDQDCEDRNRRRTLFGRADPRVRPNGRSPLKGHTDKRRARSINPKKKSDTHS